MTSDQVKAIQESFAKVAPISEQAAALFYGRLFEIAPAVKPLFRGDIEERRVQDRGRKVESVLQRKIHRIHRLGRHAPLGFVDRLAELVHHGHIVLVERAAGAGAGLDDEDYRVAGGTLVDGP